MDSLLEQVNYLINMQVGDPHKLQYIKSELEQNHILRLSDKKYLHDLLQRYIQNPNSYENQTPKIEPEPKRDIPKQVPKITKRKMGKGKKLLIGMGVFLIIIIFGVIVIVGTSGASVVNNNEDKTPFGISENSQILEIDESKHLGTMIVEIDKIEIFDTFAKVFVSVENLGPDEAHLFETNTYVVQGKTQFKTKIPKPFGASGDWIDGNNIPPQIIKEGIIFLELWNPSEPFDLYLDGMYIRQDGFGGLPKDIQFVFHVEPKQTNSMCGTGTIFDEKTNSCIIK